MVVFDTVCVHGLRWITGSAFFSRASADAPTSSTKPPRNRKSSGSRANDTGSESENAQTSDNGLLSPHRETPLAYLKHRAAMKASFPEGWNPPRKLSREAMAGLRALHATDPDLFNTPMLAEKFRISPEAVRRILKAKWVPRGEERVRMVKKERERKDEWMRRARDEVGERERVGKWEKEREVEVGRGRRMG